jgi:hypothetical protein
VISHMHARRNTRGRLREAAAGAFEGSVDVAREGWSVDL